LGLPALLFLGIEGGFFSFLLRNENLLSKEAGPRCVDSNGFIQRNNPVLPKGFCNMPFFQIKDSHLSLKGSVTGEKT